MSSFIDVNYRSIDQSNVVDVTPQLMDASEAYNDTLKLSNNITGVTVANKTIINRNEDCVDLCRVSGSNFLRLTLRPFGQNGITVKGASMGNDFHELRFESHGRRCDIEIGQFDNYWYPGRHSTDANLFSEAADFKTDKPVRILLWDSGDRNVFLFANKKITRIPKFIWFPYFLFRYVWLRFENEIRRLRNLKPILTK